MFSGGGFFFWVCPLQIRVKQHKMMKILNDFFYDKESSPARPWKLMICPRLMRQLHNAKSFTFKSLNLHLHKKGHMYYQKKICFSIKRKFAAGDVCRLTSSSIREEAAWVGGSNSWQKEEKEEEH